MSLSLSFWLLLMTISTDFYFPLHICCYGFLSTQFPIFTYLPPWVFLFSVCTWETFMESRFFPHGCQILLTALAQALTVCIRKGLNLFSLQEVEKLASLPFEAFFKMLLSFIKLCLLWLSTYIGLLRRVMEFFPTLFSTIAGLVLCCIFKTWISLSIPQARGTFQGGILHSQLLTSCLSMLSYGLYINIGIIVLQQISRDTHGS